jgi:hypothetical protein
MAKTPQEARALLLAACQSANRYVHVDRETLILACTEDDAPRAQTRAAVRVLPKQKAPAAPPKPLPPTKAEETAATASLAVKSEPAATDPQPPETAAPAEPAAE